MTDETKREIDIWLDKQIEDALTTGLGTIKIDSLGIHSVDLHAQTCNNPTDPPEPVTIKMLQDLMVEMEDNSIPKMTEWQEAFWNTILERKPSELQREAYMAGRGGKSNMALKMLAANLYPYQSHRMGMHTMIGKFRKTDMIIVDEYSHHIGIDYASLEERVYAYSGDFIPDDRDQHDWKRTKFVSGGETPPSKSKRAKLRAKRKKRK